MTDLIETVARVVNGDKPDARWEPERWQDQRDALEIAANAIRAIEAAGYKIVPVESTQDMRNAGFMAMNQYGKRDMDKIYEAMLAAAPKVVP